VRRLLSCQVAAIQIMASWVAGRVSLSRTRRRNLVSQAKEYSTTQRRWRRTKPGRGACRSPRPGAGPTSRACARASGAHYPSVIVEPGLKCRREGRSPPGREECMPTPSTNAGQWSWPCRPRDSTGVAPGRVHCGTGRLVGPQVAFPSASERQYQHAWLPSGQPSGLSSHASPRP
jgi:hypothetical protein